MIKLIGMKDKLLVDALIIFHEMLSDMSFDAKVNYKLVNKDLKYSIEDGICLQNKFEDWNKAINDIKLTKAFANEFKNQDVAILITYMVLDRICEVSKPIGHIHSVQKFTYNDRRYYIVLAGKKGIYALLPSEFFQWGKEKRVFH